MAGKPPYLFEIWKNEEQNMPQRNFEFYHEARKNFLKLTQKFEIFDESKKSIKHAAEI